MAIAATLIVTSSPARSAVFNVASGDVSGLIAAIKAANANTNEPHTISLAAGTYKVKKVDNTVDGPNAFPTITRRITIVGKGASTTVIKRTSSNKVPMRLFHVSPSGSLILQKVTVTNGLLTSGSGGAIHNAGHLMVIECTVSNNHICELEDSDQDGILTCSWIGTGPGGGIANLGEGLVEGSTISGNSAAYGGGIYSPGTLNLFSSLVTGNIVDDAAGAGTCAGLVLGGVSNVRNTTVTRNAASVQGGGICTSGDQVWIVNSAIVGNGVADGDGAGIVGSVRLGNTIVLGNSSCDEGAPPGYCPLPSDCEIATIQSFGHNIVGTGCDTNGPGDRSVAPSEVFTKVLGSLQNNGGSMLTYNLIPGGPAIDVGGQMYDSTDQRGGTRPQDGNGDGTTLNDAGPVEFNPVAWNNYAFAGGTGTFSVTFDGIAHQDDMNGVMGLSAGQAKNATGMATTVRFNSAGLIDVRNGGVYAADHDIPYQAGKKYRFRLLLDVPLHRYSVFVKPETDPEETLATNFAFRTEQQSVSSLGYWFMKAFAGSHSMNNFNQGYLSTTKFQSRRFQQSQGGRFSMIFNAIPHQANIDGLMGVASGAVTNAEHLAAIVRFSTAGKIDARNGGAYAADLPFSYTAGTRYQFRMVVDVLNHTYDVFVRPEGVENEVQIATTFAFRTEQQNVSTIAMWALRSLVGSHTMEAVTVTQLPDYE
jgi:predicted outer membrane repeat protein